MGEIALQRVDDYRWRIPQTGKMRVPGMVYADAEMIQGLGNEEALKQVANVAHLSGILKYSLAMPDEHWGYTGFRSAVSWPSIGTKGSSRPEALAMTSTEGSAY